MKKKWAVWKTILVMLASVFVVTGVTVGAIFLRNGGSGDVYPDDLYFVTEGQTLYRVYGDQGQFELSDNNVITQEDIDNSTTEGKSEFNLTISSNTEGVTSKQIELSLEGGTTYNDLNIVTDGVITVPKYVTLGEPFKIIRFDKSMQVINSKGETEQCVTGGISKLIATSWHRTSQGLDYERTEVTIAVDTPVKNIEIQLYAIEDGQEVPASEVSENETFYARAKFYPCDEKNFKFDSRYLYNDVKRDRKKEIYFQASDESLITFVPDSDAFANQTAKFIASAMGGTTIAGYTYRTADLQDKFSDVNADEDIQDDIDEIDAYKNALLRLKNMVEQGGSITSSAGLTVKVQPIKNFVGTTSSLSNITQGKRYTLALQDYQSELEAKNKDYNGYLGVQVIGRDDKEIKSMLSNVALAFYKEDGTPVDKELEIFDALGNPAVPAFEREQDVNGTSKNIKYYRPNTNVNENFPEAGYWTLFTNNGDVKKYKVEAVLLELKDRDGDVWDVFKLNDKIEVSISFTLNVVPPAKVDVDWANNADINISLSYDENSGAASALSYSFNREELSGLPAGQDPVFFAYFGNLAEEADARANNVLVDYDANRSGVYNVDGQLRLYALRGETLRVKSADKFVVYFAVVKGTSEQGLYEIVDISQGRNVNVLESLNQRSFDDHAEVTVTGIGGEEVEPFENIYRLYPDEQAVIEITVKVAPQSWEVFQQQYGDLAFSIYFDGTDITDYFNRYLEDGAEWPKLDAESNTAVYSYRLKSTLDLENSGLSLDNNGIAISHFQLSNAQFTKKIEMQFQDETKGIYIYTPKIESIDFDTSLLQNVTVLYVLSGEGLTKTVSYNGVGPIAVDEFVNNLKEFITINEKYGNSKYFDSLWSFATDTPSLVSVNKQTFDFVNETSNNLSSAKIWITCDNLKSTELDLTFNRENGKIVKIDKDGTTDTQNLSSIDLARKGTKSTDTITLRDLFKLYTAEDVQFDQFKIRFNGASLSTLDKQGRLDDLFATGGMISVNGQTFDSANLLQSLTSIDDVFSITINDEFVLSEILNFVIYDGTGIVNIALNLTIERALELSGVTEGQTVWAAQRVDTGVSLVEGDIVSAIMGDETTQYIIAGENGYVLQTADSDLKIGTVVGEGGKLYITFEDIYNISSRTFTIHFGDTANEYRLSFTINYSVRRNIKITKNNRQYDFAGSDNSLQLWDYFGFERISNGETINGDLLAKLKKNTVVKTADNGFFKLEQATLKFNDDKPVFAYGQGSIEQFFEFYYVDIDGVDVADLTPESQRCLNSDNVTECKIVVEGLSYQNIANNLSCNTDNGQVKAKLVELDDKQYIYLQAGNTWTVDVNAQFKIYQSFEGYNQTQNYSSSNGTEIFVLSIASAMVGRNDQSYYLIVAIQTSGVDVAYMIVPVIISNLGIELVRYDTKVADSTVENALATIDSLKENGVYQEVYAGQRYKIVHELEFGKTVPATYQEGSEAKPLFGFLYNSEAGSNIMTSVSQFGTNSKLFKIFADGYLTLNHLTNEAEYVGLSFTINANEFDSPFTYYFLLKVLPDVSVAEQATYAYSVTTNEETAEYVSISIGDEKTLQLDEIFGNETLNAGKTRFNVYAYNKDSGYFDQKYNPQYSHQFVSLNDTTKPYSIVEQSDSRWLFDVLEATFAVQDGKTTLTLRPIRDSRPLTFIFKRVYHVSNGDSIVDGEAWASISYVIKINAGKPYNIKYGSEVNKTTNSDGTLDIGYEYYNGGSGKTIDVTLYNGDSRTTGMQMVDYSNLTAEQKKAIKSLHYENDKLTIVRCEYVEKYTEVPVTFYTDEGYLGTLTLRVGASGHAVFGNTELTAGQDNTISSLDLSVTLDGMLNSSFTVASVEVKQVAGQTSEVFKEFDVAAQKIKLYSLVKDTKITLSFVLHFGQNPYMFEQEFTVKANIKDGDKAISPDNSAQPVLKSGESIIAGTGFTKNIAGLVSFTNDGACNAENFKFIVKLANGSGDDVYVDGTTSQEFTTGKEMAAIPTFHTRNVSTTTPIEILITVKLMHGQEEYQTFYILYSFNIMPNVNIQPTYPSIDENGQPLEQEYIEDGAEFANVESFVNGTATFAANKRLVIKEAKSVQDNVVTWGSQKDLSGTYTFTIIEMQNITVVNGAYVDSSAPNEYRLNSDVKGRFTLKKGTYSTDRRGFVDSGYTSFVTFRLTINEVYNDFTVIVDTSVYGIVQTLTDKNDDGAELLYVDRYTDSDAILAENRLVSVTFNSRAELSRFENTKYQMVFKSDSAQTLTKGNTFAMEFLLTNAFFGQTKVFDIGRSATEYLGTFEAGVDYLNGNELAEGKVDTTLFDADDEIQLLSRLQLTYGGRNVPQSKLGQMLNFEWTCQLNNSDKSGTTTKLSEHKIAPDNIEKVCTLSQFKLVYANGQTLKNNVLATFEGTTYSYSLDIDVDCDTEFKPESQIKVGQEIKSVLENRNVRQKSNGQPITSGQLNDDRNINLAVVRDFSVLDSALAKQLKSTYAGIDSPNAKNGDDPEYDYLSVSRRTEENEKDFRIVGRGAKNDGNYILLQFSYIVTLSGKTEYIKVFYIVYKVVPEYTIQYQGTNSEQTELGSNEAQVPTNRDHPAMIDLSGSTYTFAINGSDQNAIVKAIRAYDGRDVAKSFAYTLTEDDVTGYNISTNVENKLKPALEGWTTNSNPYTWNNQTDDLKFEGIKEVIFGQQQYRLVAEDKFGYQFLVYFTLKSTEPLPVATNTLTISEGGKFDIGAMYESLTVTKDSNKVDIASSGKIAPEIPVVQDGAVQQHFELVILNNIEAWGYATNPTTGGTGITSTDTGYNGNLSQEADRKYLSAPKLFNITIESITFEKEGFEPKTIEKGSEKYTLATLKDLIFVDKTFRNPEPYFTMPKLDGWFGGDSTIKDVTMVITLTYGLGDNTDVLGDNTEKVTINVPTTVTRQYNIVPSMDKTVVRDGEDITLSDVFKIASVEPSTANMTFYDDTLKVSLPANSDMTIELTATHNGNSYTSTFRVPNSYAYPRIEYESMSRRLGVTLAAGDKVTVRAVSSSGNGLIGNVKGKEYRSYFIQYGENIIVDTETTSKEISITAITKDKINIESPSRVYTHGDGIPYADVTKYYLVAVGSNGDNATYQISQAYRVTPYYSMFEKNYDDVIKILDVNGENATYTLDLATWSKDMRVIPAKADSNGNVVAGGAESLDAGNSAQQRNIYFAINTDDQSSGDATIVNGSDNFGQLTLGAKTGQFNKDEYVSISVYVRISGFGGNFATEDVSQMILLETVRIMIRVKA